jgi:hypothetical protein
MNNPQLSRKEEIQKGCGRKLNNGLEYSVCGEWSEKHKKIWFCKSCRKYQEGRTQAISEFKEKLKKALKTDLTGCFNSQKQCDEWNKDTNEIIEKTAQEIN